MKLDRSSLYFNKEIRSPFLAVEFYKDLRPNVAWDFRYRKRPLRILAKKLGHIDQNKTGYSFSWDDMIFKFDMVSIISELGERYTFVPELLKYTSLNSALKWRMIHLYLWTKKRS